MIGAKTPPTLAVPYFWTKNSRKRMSRVDGSTYGLNAGVTTSRPSAALSTEIAGVMTPSPYRRAAPNSPSARRTPRRRFGRSRARRATMPPSP